MQSIVNLTDFVMTQLVLAGDVAVVSHDAFIVNPWDASYKAVLRGTSTIKFDSSSRITHHSFDWPMWARRPTEMHACACLASRMARACWILSFGVACQQCGRRLARPINMCIDAWCMAGCVLSPRGASGPACLSTHRHTHVNGPTGSV